MVLVDGQAHHRAVGQALHLIGGSHPNRSERRKNLGKEVDTTPVKASPHIIILVEQQASDAVARKTVIAKSLFDERTRHLGTCLKEFPVYIEYGNAHLLGGHQHLAIGQFTEIEDAMTAEYLVGHMQETLTERIEDIDASTRTNPYRSALVTIQAVHLIA